MKRLVVIGNGMAACRLLEELTHLASDLYQITVVGRSPCRLQPGHAVATALWWHG